MKFVLALLVIAAITSGCEGTTIFISTSPSTIVVRAGHVDGGTIVVGRPMAGSLTGPHSTVHYRVVPPRTGTLVLHVNWDRRDCVVGVQFANTTLHASPGSIPPIMARLPVQGGQSYEVQIMDGRSGDASALDVSFTVTTSIE
jgi:hypothetical protein